MKLPVVPNFFDFAFRERYHKTTVPEIFQSERRSSNMEAVPMLPMVEFELKSR